MEAVSNTQTTNCASCQQHSASLLQKSASGSNLLLLQQQQPAQAAQLRHQAQHQAQAHSNSSLLAVKGASKDVLDESLCGDPLMYATFVAPVQQYSTETEPSRQASFNYPSRQPSFKQNSSEGAESQPDILGPSSAAGPMSAHLGVPSLNLRSSLTPPDTRNLFNPVHAHSSGDELVQDIFAAEIPPEWPPLPPVPGGGAMQKDQDCMEISQEELERQVCKHKSFQSQSHVPSSRMCVTLVN